MIFLLALTPSASAADKSDNCFCNFATSEVWTSANVADFFSAVLKLAFKVSTVLFSLATFDERGMVGGEGACELKDVSL